MESAITAVSHDSQFPAESSCRFLSEYFSYRVFVLRQQFTEGDGVCGFEAGHLGRKLICGSIIVGSICTVNKKQTMTCPVCEALSLDITAVKDPGYDGNIVVCRECKIYKISGTTLESAKFLNTSIDERKGFLAKAKQSASPGELPEIGTHFVD